MTAIALNPPTRPGLFPSPPPKLSDGKSMLAMVADCDLPPCEVTIALIVGMVDGNSEPTAEQTITVELEALSSISQGTESEPKVRSTEFVKFIGRVSSKFCPMIVKVIQSAKG